MRLFSSLSLLIIVIATSCTEKNETARDIIIDGTIDSVLNFAAAGFYVRKDSIIFIHWEVYPDNAKKFMMPTLRKSEQFIQYSSLFEKLNNVLDDSLKYKIDKHSYRNILVLENMPKNKSFYKDERLLGTINLSNSVREKGDGAYYFAVNCGNKCSTGFIIVTELVGDRWRVKEILRLWTG